MIVHMNFEVLPAETPLILHTFPFVKLWSSKISQ